MLTGLLNRSVLEDEINNQILAARRESQSVAVFSINIDGFKQINSTLGAARGDELLVSLAASLQNRFDSRSLVGRMGGDEFLVALRGDYDHSTLSEFAIDIVALSHDLTLSDGTSQFTCCVGLSVYPDDGEDGQALLNANNVAVEQAKVNGPGTYRLYNDAFRAEFEAQHHLVQYLKEAIRDRAFSLVYQPQYSVQTDQITGVEVLVRWRHKNWGLVPPSEFIPLAERHGLIQPITAIVLSLMVEDLITGGLLGNQLERVSINVSAHDFDNSEHLDALIRLLEQHQTLCLYIQFEITETAIMQNLEASVQAMKRLRAMGIRFSIDDFGTGYSSLSMLKTLPVHELKIDQSFIRDIPADANDAMIARTIIVMGQSLNMRLVAEGVETEKQKAFLAKNGCDEIQGYLMSKPLDIDGLKALLFETD